MQTFVQIVEKIKKIKGLALDYEVADLLSISKKAFAANKTRNSIPFAELATFCGTESISLNWLIADQGPQKLQNDSLAEPPRHPAAALIPVPDFNPPPGIDPTVQAMSDIKEIFDSGDPILIPAIQANLHAFKRALLRERQFEQILKENEELKKRILKLEELCAELKDKFESLQAENRTLRTENNRLKSTYEAAPDGDHGDLTTDKKAM